MPRDLLSNLAPDRTVKILPRYLAGPGHADPRRVWGFPTEDGWPFHQKERGGPAAAMSPCLRLWTTFEPQPGAAGKGIWTTGVNRAPSGPGAWRISFGNAPVELLKDVHAELLDLYLENQDSDRALLFEDPTPAYDAYSLLLANNWSHSVDTNGTQTFRSPDGLAAVQHRYAITDTEKPTWTAWAETQGQRLWSASFSIGTPASLAVALTASLVSTEPVHRAVKDVPLPSRQHLYYATATQPTAPAVPPPASAARSRPF
ncbi:DUF317 domain-containing protein [Streptomyces cyaneofuscatus]|uniref:DUF317 domain-containing protein n=1 Tax=Streptomyces cyaneofuscatus TaxID=66883 RepID=UPI0037F6709A